MIQIYIFCAKSAVVAGREEEKTYRKRDKVQQHAVDKVIREAVDQQHHGQNEQSESRYHSHRRLLHKSAGYQQHGEKHIGYMDIKGKTFQVESRKSFYIVQVNKAGQSQAQ